MRRRAAAVALAVVFGGETCAADAGREALVSAYRCHLETVLTDVYASRSRKDRFVILSPRDNAGQYVQCLLGGGKKDSEALCEVASGALAAKPSEPVHDLVSKEGVAALAALGFARERDWNFSQVAIVRKGDARPLATLMLSALNAAFGVGMDRVVEVQAPLALDDRVTLTMTGACTPVA